MHGLGEEGRLGHPRGDVDLEEPRTALGVDDQVAARPVAQPVASCARAAPSRRTTRARPGEPRRDEELGGAGGVARAVVVEAAVGHDLDDRQRARALRPSTTETATSAPSTWRSTSAVSPYAKAVIIASGSAAASRTTDDPERGPPTGGLHHQWQAEPRDDGRQHRRGAELAERLVRQRHDRRRHGAGAGEHGLGHRLVERQPARLGSRPDVRQAERLEHVADGAVLAGSAVQHRDHRTRPVGRQRREQVGIDVEDDHVRSDGAQGVGQAAPGAQRHVALGREAAGEQDDRAVGGTRVFAVNLMSGAVLSGVLASCWGRRGVGQPSRPTRRGCGAEGRVQLELVLDDPGEPADALADPVGLGVAVRKAAGSAGRVAAGRRRSRCRGRTRPGRRPPRQHRGGVQALGQRDPRVEAAAGDGPGVPAGSIAASDSSSASRRSR